MATTFNTNSGIHQLPPNCYPPSDSDDEDSFVVLNNSLGPDVHTDRVHYNTEPISTLTIQASLDSIADAMAQVTQSANAAETQTQLCMDSSQVNFPSTEISPDEIQQKVDNLIGENMKLKDTLAQNNIAMKKQVDTITQWQEEVQRVQESHKEKFTDMKKYIGILKAENEQLKDLIKKAETRSVEDEKKTRELLVKQNENIRQFELEAAQKKIKEMEKALDMLSLENEEYGKKMIVKEKLCTDLTTEKTLLTNELDLCKAAVNNSKSSTQLEIQALKDEIVELRDTNNNLISQVTQLRNQNEQLQTELAKREEKQEQVDRAVFGFEQDLVQTKQQLMASQMHITELKESNAKMVSGKELEINSLQQQLKLTKINNDENAALRAQLDLYKNDFEMERSQRKELLAEKNRIADDLQQLQRRNHQLHEEIDQMKSGFVPVKTEEVRGAPSDSPPLQRHFCPICSAKFGSIRLLEDHIEYCLANANT